jgi:hypothetical protein
MSNYSKTNYNKRTYPKPEVKFSTYRGTFLCQGCKAEVHRARFWRDTFDFTWMCECKYVSKVNFYGKGY